MTAPVEIRPMVAGDREAVLELLELAFGGRDDFVRSMDLDPAFAWPDYLLALVGERPVACVQSFAKRVRLRGEEIQLGGIGSVASHPEQRGRGLARELLRRSEARMRAQGRALGLLFTEVPDFYAPLGWRRILARQVALHAPPGPSEALDLTARPFRLADLPAVRGLYERYSSRLDGTTLRDAPYWDGQLRYAGSPDERFLVGERTGRVVAYARGVVLHVPFAMEYAHEPGHADALAALLLALCPDSGAMLLRLPPATELEPELRRRARRVDRADDPTLMWRVLDRDRLARLARLPATSEEAAILAELIERPPAHYWLSDRF